MLPIQAMRFRRAAAITATASPTSADGVSSSTPATTNSVSVSVSGGSGSYTHSWAYVSGDTSIAISSTTAATVSWSRGISGPADYSATWRDTVTDTVSGATTTVDVPVTTERV